MRYVIALGGNALTKAELLNSVSAKVVALARKGNEIIITHGNGPQVGKLAMHEKRSLALLTRETQEQIGAEVKKSLLAAAKRQGKVDVEVVFTHVFVDKNDKEFANPTKPIGSFYKEGKARSMMKKGFAIKHLLEGYRRVVPSPKPKAIEELARIEHMAEKRGSIIIAGGGGGIAIIKKAKGFEYANAVIDKDLTSALLAIKFKADRFLILTNVDGAYLNFETKKEKKLRRVKVKELQKYVKSGQFEAGSMLPKIRACIEFVKKTKMPAVIAHLEKADKAFELKGATVIVP